MRESEMEILEQYDIDVKQIKKIREAFLCETDRGLLILQEMKSSEKKLPALFRLGEHLKEQGCIRVDQLLKNKEGQLSSASEEGKKYVVKEWFPGRECDIRKEADVLDAVQNLTRIHKALKEPVDWEDDFIQGREQLESEWLRHNRELKKVRTFIRGRVGKGDFESLLLKSFDSLYAWAEGAVKRLQASQYYALLEESGRKHMLVHGDYNYHNLIFTPSGVATTHFEHFQEDIQVTDLYYFLRKTMEKHQWDVRLGSQILECYQKEISLSKAELEYMAICIAYPEKFWKIINSYSRSKKSWIPAKNQEKLELVIRQTDEKKEFLKRVFAFEL